MRSASSGTLREMYRNSRAEAFGPEVTRRIILGTYVLSSGYYDAYYRKAQEVRSLIAQDFAEAFESVDAIITPVSPFPAFKLGEKTSDPLRMYLSDIYTITGSLAGIAGMSVPCGKSPEGLPSRHADPRPIISGSRRCSTWGTHSSRPAGSMDRESLAPSTASPDLSGSIRSVELPRLAPAGEVRVRSGGDGRLPLYEAPAFL